MHIIIMNRKHFLNCGLQATEQDHSYVVIWTLQLKVTDQKGYPVKNADITIFDKNQSKVLLNKTEELGNMKTELLECAIKGKLKTYASPYNVVLGDVKKEVLLNGNKNITLIAE